MVSSTGEKVNVYLRQQKMHDIEIEKAKMSIEAKEKAALEEDDCWIYALIGVKPPKPMVEKSIEEMVLVIIGVVVSRNNLDVD